MTSRTSKQIVFPRKRVRAWDGTMRLRLVSLGQWQRARWNYNDTALTAKDFRQSIWPALWYAYEKKNTESNLDYDRMMGEKDVL